MILVPPLEDTMIHRPLDGRRTIIQTLHLPHAIITNLDPVGRAFPSTSMRLNLLRVATGLSPPSPLTLRCVVTTIARTASALLPGNVSTALTMHPSSATRANTAHPHPPNAVTMANIIHPLRSTISRVVIPPPPSPLPGGLVTAHPTRAS